MYCPDKVEQKKTTNWVTSYGLGNKQRLIKRTAQDTDFLTNSNQTHIVKDQIKHYYSVHVINK